MLPKVNDASHSPTEEKSTGSFNSRDSQSEKNPRISSKVSCPSGTCPHCYGLALQARHYMRYQKPKVIHNAAGRVPTLFRS